MSRLSPPPTKTYLPPDFSDFFLPPPSMMTVNSGLSDVASVNLFYPIHTVPHFYSRYPPIPPETQFGPSPIPTRRQTRLGWRFGSIIRVRSSGIRSRYHARTRSVFLFRFSSAVLFPLLTFFRQPRRRWSSKSLTWCLLRQLPSSPRSPCTPSLSSLTLLLLPAPVDKDKDKDKDEDEYEYYNTRRMKR